jgi:hypothetical protein
MTIVNWYEPIDLWMRVKIANAISHESKQSLGESPAAAACYIIIHEPEKLKYPEQLSMYALERVIRKYISDTDLLRRTAYNSDNVIFNLKEPEDYSSDVCEFIVRVCIEAKRLSEEFESSSIFFTDAVLNLRKRVGLE